MIKPLVAVYVLLLTFINSQRIYEVILEASSVVFSGTDDTLWFRLCNDIGACGRFQEILGGLSTDQLFSVNYTSNIDLGALLTGSLSLLTTGGDQLCLSDIYVEGNNYDAGLTPYCIDADDNIYPRAECEVLTVNFAKDVGSDWDIDSSNPCSYTYEYNQTTTVPPIDEYSELIIYLFLLQLL